MAAIIDSQDVVVGVVVHGVLVGAGRHGYFLPRFFYRGVVEVSKELLHTEVPQVRMAKEELLHVVEVILVIRIAKDGCQMFFTATNPGGIWHHEVRV